MFFDFVLVIIKEKPCLFYNGGKYSNFFWEKAREKNRKQTSNCKRNLISYCWRKKFIFANNNEIKFNSMKTQKIKALFAQFEQDFGEFEGIEYWSARERQTLLTPLCINH